jgi:hypothetical protein
MKYPCDKLNWVKWNRVLDMQQEGEVLTVRRLMCSRFPFGQSCHVLEEIVIDKGSRVMSMRSRVVKRSGLLPDLAGTERIIYKAFNNATLYFKEVTAGSALKDWLEKVNSSFHAGCKVVEARTIELLENPAIFLK